MSTYEIWSLAVSATGTVLVVISLVFTGREIRNNSIGQKAGLDWQRKIAAQNAIAHSHEREAKEYIESHFHHTHSPRRIPLAEILAQLEPTFDVSGRLIMCLHRVLNSYEALARGVHIGIYDADVLKDARDIPMKAMYHAFAEYLTHREQLRGANPWKHLETLVKQWGA